MAALNTIWIEWRVEELIGQGSFGKVYRISRESMGHVSYAAAKVIEIPQSDSDLKALASMGMDDGSIRSYLESNARAIVNEISLMETLKGANNIVAIEDYRMVERKDNVGWTIWIRMELLQDLVSYQHKNPPTVAETVKIGIDICNALVRCHSIGIVHRDVKPENVFRSSFGDYKLGDFGIARQMETMTRAMYSQKGTRFYMAPEVMNGEEYGSNVDIYSLGMMLYRYLNDMRFPFMPSAPKPVTTNDMQTSLVMRLRGDRLPAPCNADPQLASIVLKACEADPKKRYVSAGEMLADLKAWQQLVSIDAPTQVVYVLDDASDPTEIVSVATDELTQVITGELDEPTQVFADEDNELTQIIGTAVNKPTEMFSTGDDELTELFSAVDYEPTEAAAPIKNTRESPNKEAASTQSESSLDKKRSIRFFVLGIVATLVVALVVFAIVNYLGEKPSDVGTAGNRSVTQPGVHDASVPDGVYSITTSSNGVEQTANVVYAVEAPGSQEGSTGAIIQLNLVDHAVCQCFKLQSDSDGTYRISDVVGDLVLQPIDDDVSSDAAVLLAEDVGDDNQRWYICSNADEQYYFKNKGTNLCVCIGSDGLQNGPQLSFCADEADALPFVLNREQFGLYEVGLTWDEAKQLCEDMGGHLAVISSENEQQAVTEILAENNGIISRNSFWLGGYQENGEWKWVTGESFDYTNWAPRQPDNYYEIETRLMVYRGINPPWPEDSQENKIGEWNDIEPGGTCQGQEFFGLSNFGLICEWE